MYGMLQRVMSVCRNASYKASLEINRNKNTTSLQWIMWRTLLGMLSCILMLNSNECRYTDKCQLNVLASTTVFLGLHFQEELLTKLFLWHNIYLQESALRRPPWYLLNNARSHCKDLLSHHFLVRTHDWRATVGKVFLMFYSWNHVIVWVCYLI